MSKRITRRQFLHKAALGTAALAMPAVVPSAVFGSAQRSAPSDRITLGFIGLGGMGMAHLNGFLGNGQVQVLAVCDVYAPHRDRAKKAVDNRYGNQDCAACTDFRHLLDRKDIDAVVISTPDHWHTLNSILACEAGKDVYCEKPLTLFVDEGKALVRAVRRYNRVFQVGSQQRSEYYFWLACMLVRNGKIGKVHTVRVNLPGGPDMDPQPDVEPPPDVDWNLYLGPAPWVPFNYARFLGNFRWFWDYSGGTMTDWGHHHFDIAQWGLGRDLSAPVSVEGRGVPPIRGLCETYVNFEVHYEYADGVRMVATTPERGVRFDGSDGYVHVWRGGIDTSPKELQQMTWGPNDTMLERSLSHHQNWLDCIRTRKRPICDVEIGHRSVTVAHIGNIAMRLGRKLRWDPVKEQFVGDHEANRWLSRPYRAPWYLR